MSEKVLLPDWRVEAGLAKQHLVVYLEVVMGQLLVDRLTNLVGGFTTV